MTNGRRQPRRAGGPAKARGAKRGAAPRSNDRRGRQSGGTRSTGPRSDQRSAGRATKARRPEGLGGDQVEGRNAVRELLLGRRQVREVYLLDDPDSPALAELRDLAGDRRVTVHVVSERRLDSVARTSAPQGVVARAAPLHAVPLEELAERRAPAGGPPLLAALDGITDPGNLGAVLRSIEALGFSGAVLPAHRAVRITPAAAKAAAGAVEHLPLALVGGIPAALTELRKRGLWVVGLDGSATHRLDDLRVADEGMVLVLGSEGAGLGRLTRQRCDDLVAIPQHGRTESLNVAAAAAVAGYEIIRRRRSGAR